ncbi:hypothetical protein RV15_GL003552 [Enterococcus silesiacus]|uniref:Uncharacterized protein n=1 Tax=Enterococcus silesiacus TaxID=332949 RepID=A0AA91GAP4_9ENTE|nr:hypothetical protein RV15_GL003552 [Enterococcus silesiacus]
MEYLKIKNVFDEMYYTKIKNIQKQKATGFSELRIKNLIINRN